MPTAPINGIEIYYETFGNSDDPALVLINGLGSQCIRWPQDFRDAIVAEGFHLVVFDNRDVGLSTKFAGASVSPAYSVDDMADDVAGLLDHLGIAAAHIVGQSMGGMIGQVLAIRHPERVLSLASIMSATGDGMVLSTNADALAIFSEPAATTREEAIEQDVRQRRLIGGAGFPFDEDAMRDLAERTYDRCYAPDGRVRQMLAVQGAPGRAQALAKLTIPVVVIHGTDDPLVPVENGRRTAEAIPGAELVEIEGMGHDLPSGARARIVAAIVRNAQRATARA
jgi:pimeloyl-ACP methyl ester carboxylesterase